MALFFNTGTPVGTGRRLTGFARYCELLERDFKRFFIVNALTILGFLPFICGVIFSILSSSILFLIPMCIASGTIAGPALSCMYDTVFRSLRDAPGKCMENYKRALKQNWRQSVIPGIILCLLLGFYAFMMVIMWWWAQSPPGFGTITIFILGFTLMTMFFSIYWPQLVLFEQTGRQRFKNCLLFIIRFFWKVLGCSLLQVLYWTLIVLFLPWSVIVLPLTGVWFIVYAVNFLLYNTLDSVFHIEEQIAQAFPEQVAYYEDDESWLKRKQEEQNQTD